MNVSPNTLLIEALRSEIENLRRIKQEAVINRRDFADVLPQTLRDLRGISGNLADIYQGAENAFQRIAKATEEGLPSGKDWHRQLLDQMSREVRDVRPPVINPETHALLEQFRSFRHLMRHLYGFNLDWSEMKSLVMLAEKAIDLLISDLDTFCSFLEQIDE